MNGASGKVVIWNFFFWNGLYFHHTKNQPVLRPRSTFSEHWPWFWPYLFSEKVMKLFWYKIWVIFWSKNHFLQFRGVFWLRNKHLLLSTFCSFQNPREHLNLQCNEESQSQNACPWIANTSSQLFADPCKQCIWRGSHQFYRSRPRMINISMRFDLVTKILFAVQIWVDLPKLTAKLSLYVQMG